MTDTHTTEGNGGAERDSVVAAVGGLLGDPLVHGVLTEEAIGILRRAYVALAGARQTIPDLSRRCEALERALRDIRSEVQRELRGQVAATIFALADNALAERSEKAGGGKA